MLAETYVENLNWAADHLAVVDQSGLPAPLTAKFAICTSLPLLYWGGNMNDLDMLQGLQRYKEAQIKAVKVSVTSTRNFGECRSVVRKGVIDYNGFNLSNAIEPSMVSHSFATSNKFEMTTFNRYNTLGWFTVGDPHSVYFTQVDGAAPDAILFQASFPFPSILKQVAFDGGQWVIQANQGTATLESIGIEIRIEMTFWVRNPVEEFNVDINDRSLSGLVRRNQEKHLN